jgi:drug/metabolite transporter (DMT)-like permease
MQTKVLKSDLLLLAAFFGGATFVAQRMAMEHTGPMSYNALPLAIGALSLPSIIAIFRARNMLNSPRSLRLLVCGGLAGLVVVQLPLLRHRSAVRQCLAEVSREL